MKKTFRTTKQLLAVVILVMSITFPAKSQTNRFSLAINSLTTNYNYGKSNSSLQEHKKDYRGLQVGASYQAGISKRFSVVPEVYFAIKGGTLDKNNPLTATKTTVRLYSIEMPVLARVHFDKLYFNAGPYGGYNVGGRIKMAGVEGLPDKKESVSFGNSADDFKRWDLGFQAGAGYNFNIKQAILTLDIRYGYGITSVSNDVDRYNRSLNVSLVLTKPCAKNKKSVTE